MINWYLLLKRTKERPRDPPNRFKGGFEKKRKIEYEAIKKSKLKFCKINRTTFGSMKNRHTRSYHTYFIRKLS